MAASYVNSATSTSTTVTVPTHQIGDVIIIFASSLTTTPPTLPSGWTNLQTKVGASTSLRVGYKYATSTSDGSGTWTGASALNCVIYRNLKIFNDSSDNTGSSTTINYPAKTFASGPGDNSVVIMFAQKNISVAPLTPASTTSRSSIASTNISTKACEKTGINGISSTNTTEAASSEWITMTLILQPTEGYRYWVGGDGNWDTTSTMHWSTSMYGPGGSTNPNSNNTVYFSQYSASGGSCNVTITEDINVEGIISSYFISGTLTNTTHSITAKYITFEEVIPDEMILNLGSGTWNVIGENYGHGIVLYIPSAVDLNPGTATVHINSANLQSYIIIEPTDINSRIYNLKISGNSYYAINYGAGVELNSLDLTGLTGQLSSYGASGFGSFYNDFKISGNINVPSGYSLLGRVTCDGSSPSTQTVNMGGANLFSFETIGTSTVSLSNDIKISDYINGAPFLKLSNGNFNSNGYNIQTGYIEIAVGTSGSHNFSNSTIILSHYSSWADPSSSTTINLTNTTIKITDNSINACVFAGGGKTFNLVNFSRGNSTGDIIINGSNTFNEFKDTGTNSHSIKFAAGSNNKFQSFIVQGSSGKYVTITSTSTAVHTLTKLGGGTVSSRYLNISHSIAIPENTWYAEKTSIDNQSIETVGSGWIFDYVPSITNPIQKKYYEIKVYSPSGTYLLTWKDIVSEISFTNEINSSGGQLQMTLARNAGDYGEGSDVDFGNIIKIYVYDYEAPDGILVFQGKITTYTPIYKDNNVDVIILGYGENMSTTMLQEWVTTTDSLLKPAGGVTCMGIQPPSYYSYGSIYGDLDTPGTTLFGSKITIPSGMTTIGQINFTITPVAMEVYGAPNTGYILTKDITMTIYPALTSGARSGYPDFETPLGEVVLPAGSTYSSVVTTTVNTFGNETSPKFYEFVLPELIPVTSGLSYFAVFNCAGGYEGEFNLNWYYASQSSYIGSYSYNVDSGTDFVSDSYEYPIEVYNGDGSIKIAYNSQDPSDILKDIVLKYNQQGGVLNYDDFSIDTTGTLVSYTFNTNTVLEAINKVVELCPVNWYWYIDYETNNIHLHELSTAPDHTFSLEKDLIDAKFEKRIEDIVNTIYFTGGEVSPGVNFFKKYQIASSVARYGIRSMKYSDQRVTLPATSEIIANSILERKSEPELRITLDVLDSNNNQGLGYDIESIKVGDVVAVRNVSQQVGLSSWDIARFDEAYWDYNIYNLSSLQVQIQRIDYHENYVTLQASTMMVDVNKRIEDINRNLEALQNANNPDVPT